MPGYWQTGLAPGQMKAKLSNASSGSSDLAPVPMGQKDPDKPNTSTKNAKAVHSNSISLISKIFGRGKKEEEKKPIDEEEEEEDDENNPDGKSPKNESEKGIGDTQNGSSKIGTAQPGSVHLNSTRPGYPESESDEMDETKPGTSKIGTTKPGLNSTKVGHQTLAESDEEEDTFPGSSKNGTENPGLNSTRLGKTQLGSAATNGMMSAGSPFKGTAKSGLNSTMSGQIPPGSAELDEIMSGSSKNGTAKPGLNSTRSGQIPPGSAELDEIMPGSSKNGTAKPGLNSTRSGQILPASAELGSTMGSSKGGTTMPGSGMGSNPSGSSKLGTTKSSSKLGTGIDRARHAQNSGASAPRSGAQGKAPNDSTIDEVDEFLEREMNRSNSPVLPLHEDFAVDEEGRDVQMVPCTICGRKFAVDRIQTHTSICSKQKNRKPYDVAMMRVAGTDAEELIKNGKMKLEPAKPIPKKSVLQQQLLNSSGGLAPLEPLPPIGQKSKQKTAIINSAEPPEGTKATSYQLVFDQNDDFKTKKHTKYSGFPTQMGNGKLPKKKVMDERYLSAQRTNNNNSASDYTVDSDDSDYDYLAASMTSQRTVCSDAFDFLFDSHNLNPETLQQKLERQDSSWSAFNEQANKKNKSNFCVIA